MIIERQTNFAYKCPVCFEFHEKQIGVFEIDGSTGVDIVCSCGLSQASVLPAKKHYNITVPCFACGEIHRHKLSHRSFWKSDFLSLCCPRSELDLFAVGSNENLKHWIDEYSVILEQMLDNDFE